MEMIFNRRTFWTVIVSVVAASLTTSRGAETPGQAASTWKLGAPVVTYWAGPAMTDANAKQMADGGFNLVWCATEQDLDVAQRHGLRALFRSKLIVPASLDDPAKRKKVDAIVAQVRNHPALYCYYIWDEPSTKHFADLARIVAYLRDRDPKHMAFINLLPVNAANKLLGTKGDMAPAYREHLRQYVEVVKPAMLSYDHYNFGVKSDGSCYFLNLAMMRQAAQQAKLPFMNIVQACSYEDNMRVPEGDEMRYLVYTTLAYGGQGISYFVYHFPTFKGGIALRDGTPTPLYHALKSINREFVAIATELQPLDSLGAYHAGMTPPGTAALANGARFRLYPPVTPIPFKSERPVKGMLLGYFGVADKANTSVEPTHVLVVNLNYKAEAVTTLVGSGNLEVFDAATKAWSPTKGKRAKLRLPPGGGTLVRQAAK